MDRGAITRRFRTWIVLVIQGGENYEFLDNQVRKRPTSFFLSFYPCARLGSVTGFVKVFLAESSISAGATQDRRPNCSVSRP